MTRFLSESLEAPEPLFRLGVRGLENARGNPGADIRLSDEIRRRLWSKIPELGLDPADTTASELYHGLQRRLQTDETALQRALQIRAATYVSAEAKIEAGMLHALQELTGSKTCFALKTSRFKAIMQQLPPKKVMKQMGYRSVASFVKHETPAAILAAASLLEEERWHQNLSAAYKKLAPRDFETRPVALLQLPCHKWDELAAAAVRDRKQNVLCFKEIGAVIFLPLPPSMPAGVVIANMALAVLALNEIHSASTYWKLAQVRSDFGSKVQASLASEAELNEGLLGRPLAWQLVQRYYHQLPEHFNSSIFEPHVQAGDITWHAFELLLSRLEPRLAFWHEMSHLGTVHARRPVSCNMLDVALDLAHNRSFERRQAYHFQRALWQELLLRYLHPALIEKTVLKELHPQLATEYAIA